MCQDLLDTTGESVHACNKQVDEVDDFTSLSAYMPYTHNVMSDQESIEQIGQVLSIMESLSFPHHEKLYLLIQ